MITITYKGVFDCFYLRHMSPLHSISSWPKHCFFVVVGFCGFFLATFFSLCTSPFGTSLLPSTLGTLPDCNSLLRFRKIHKTAPDMWNLKHTIIRWPLPHILILDFLKYICVSVSPTNMGEIPTKHNYTFIWMVYPYRGWWIKISAFVIKLSGWIASTLTFLKDKYNNYKCQVGVPILQHQD